MANKICMPDIEDVRGKLNKQNQAYTLQTDLLKFIIMNVKEITFVINKHGECILLNDSAHMFMEENNILDFKDIYNKFHVYNIRGELLKDKEDHIDYIFSKDAASNYKIISKGDTGKKTYYDLHSMNYYDNDGSELAIGILKDVTKKVDGTSQIALEKEASFANNLYEEWIVFISHELRSPVNVIYSATQMLNSSHYENKLSKGARKLIKKVERNTQRLLKLVNNFLDISKAEAGFMKNNLTNVNLVEYTHFIMESILPIAETNNIDMKLSHNCYVDKFSLDIGKYETILSNLLSNALKFTDDGGKIQIHIEEEKEIIKISVKDNGIGISQDAIEKIFDRFYVYNKLEDRCNRSTGIGLALVKRMLEIMKGDIEVYSTEGKGSQFIVSIPKIVGK